MKCDVCQTKIPIGSRECPNCGYKVRNDTTQVYDASGTTHEHIKTPKIKPRKKVQGLDVVVRKEKQTRIKNIVTAVITIISVLSIVFGSIVIPFLSDYFSDESSSYKTYDDMTFTDMIDEGLDQNNTISDIQEYAISLKEFLIEQGIEEIDENEYCSTFDDQLTANYNISGYKNDIRYSVEISFNSDQGLSSQGLTISHNSDKSMRKDGMAFSKEDVNPIGDYLNIPDIYDIFENSRLKMTKDKDEENHYVYSDYEDLSIYLSEQYYERENPYYFNYYSVQLRNN